jgi:hypothetical protein
MKLVVRIYSDALRDGMPAATKRLRRRVARIEEEFPIMSRIFRAFFLFGCIALSAPACFADLVAPPVPYVVSSSDGSHYFKMVPDKKDVWDKAKAKGMLYEVRSGKDKVVYRVSGWYSYQVFISNDGKYLIRMGDWPSGIPKAGDLAVAFYVDGQQKKIYNTMDLLKDPGKAPRSISHYRWLENVDASYMLSEMFSVVTVEKVEITFDIKTGEILFTEPVKGSNLK